MKFEKKIGGEMKGGKPDTNQPTPEKTPTTQGAAHLEEESRKLESAQIEKKIGVELRRKRKPKGYWEQVSTEDLKKEIQDRGLDPTDLPAMDNVPRDISRELVKRFGSFNDARKALGGEVLYERRPKGYWENLSTEGLVKEILDRGLDPKNLPSSDVLNKEHRGLLRYITRKYGDLNKARIALGGEIRRQEERDWKAMTIDEFRQMIKDQNLDPLNLPTHLETNYGNLARGLRQKFGSIENARVALGGKSVRKAWNEMSIHDFVEEIRNRNLDPANLPPISKLIETGNNDLVGGLTKRFGGFNNARKALGGKLIKRVEGFWQNISIEDLIKEIRSMGLDPASLPHTKNLDGHYDLASGLIKRFGNIGKARKEIMTALGMRIRRLDETRDEKRKKQLELEAKLAEFAQGVKDANSLETQKFQKLVGLFGSSRVIDLLYLFRPEFKGVPVDDVESVISNYLGNFLVIKYNLDPNDLAEAVEYLKEPDFKQGLTEVIKTSALDFLHQEKKNKPNESDSSILRSYFTKTRSQTSPLTNPELNAVIDDVERYYTDILNRHKPPQIIEALQKSREFPDINQLVNIEEVAEKKKVLIADEMGLGKSASVILAKEYLNIGKTLVLVPSNVVETWKEYLTTYFQPDKAPKVLVIEDLKSLDQDLSSYDYVLISHERLNEEYTEKLEGLGYNMLVIDEAHKLKNIREGKRASNTIELAKKIDGEGKYLAMLSGTPVPNKVHDVAMILRLLYPERFEHMNNQELVETIINGELVDLRNLLVPRMQMKSLRESLEIPQHIEMPPVEVSLTDAERQIYSVLLEEGNLTATKKIKTLRQFLLNPDLVKASPGVIGSKIRKLNEQLQEDFQTVDKIVVFVNNYVENVIRGEYSIVEKLNLPPDIQVKVIEGEIPPTKRAEIQNELNQSDHKILLFVSGQTADVGVDFSGGQMVYFYNEPWTKYDMDQQLARVYRPGLQQDLRSRVFITKDTIEEGIHRYIEVKKRSIEKLLKGVPLTELEKHLLSEDEKADADPEYNPELAEYYFSSWDRIMQIFSEVKHNRGEKEFYDYLSEYGQEYAECYLDLGARSYQANAARVGATILESQIETRKPQVGQVSILDIASGPEMLKKHIDEKYQSNVINMDINAFHFQLQGEGAGRVVGSFVNLPFKSESFDYANLSLALHYTRWRPSQYDYERAEVLTEANRILKVGGRLTINLIYSQDLKDYEKFKKVVEKLGLKAVEEFSGVAQRGENYKSRVVTLEKVRNVTGKIGDIMESLSLEEKRDGLRLFNSKYSPKDTKKMIENFDFDGREIDVKFNQKDRGVLEEERKIINEGRYLKERFGDIRQIPNDSLATHGFVRFYDGYRYILFKNLRRKEGVVIVK